MCAAGVCRVCLADATRTHALDARLRIVYETLSGAQLSFGWSPGIDAGWSACDSCLAQLRRVSAFMLTARNTEKMLTELHRNGVELTRGTVCSLARSASSLLSVSAVQCLSISPGADKDSVHMLEASNHSLQDTSIEAFLSDADTDTDDPTQSDDPTLAYFSRLETSCSREQSLHAATEDESTADPTLEAHDPTPDEPQTETNENAAEENQDDPLLWAHYPKIEDTAILLPQLESLEVTLTTTPMDEHTYSLTQTDTTDPIGAHCPTDTHNPNTEIDDCNEQVTVTVERITDDIPMMTDEIYYDDTDDHYTNIDEYINDNSNYSSDIRVSDYDTSMDSEHFIEKMVIDENLRRKISKKSSDKKPVKNFKKNTNKINENNSDGNELVKNSTKQLSNSSDSDKQITNSSDSDKQVTNSSDSDKQVTNGSNSIAWRYSCSECGARFRQTRELSRHKRRHKEKNHACDMCHRRYAEASQLEVHKKRHSGRYNLACTLCGRRYKQRGMLRVHMRTHTGELPYACSVCERRFNMSSNLRSHLRTHTGELPYACRSPGCAQAFNHNVSLKAHVARYHGGALPASGAPGARVQLKGLRSSALADQITAAARHGGIPGGDGATAGHTRQDTKPKNNMTVTAGDKIKVTSGDRVRVTAGNSVQVTAGDKKKKIVKPGDRKVTRGKMTVTSASKDKIRKIIQDEITHMTHRNQVIDIRSGFATPSVSVSPKYKLKSTDVKPYKITAVSPPCISPMTKIKPGDKIPTFAISSGSKTIDT